MIFRAENPGEVAIKERLEVLEWALNSVRVWLLFLLSHRFGFER
jgi:hypothetical protein